MFPHGTDGRERRGKEAETARDGHNGGVRGTRLVVIMVTAAAGFVIVFQLLNMLE